MEAASNTSLAGRVAVVTGATSGIGRAIALAFADAGASVGAVGRDRARLDEVTAAIADRGVPALDVAADLTDPAAPGRVVELVTDRLGPIDTLVHAAAIFEKATVADDDGALLERHWRANTLAPFLLTRAALPRMRDGGSIVFLTSTVSRIAFADTAGYAMSKAAIDALTRVLAVECGPRRIRVNAISPGWIATPMNEGMRQADPTLEQNAIAATPLGRLGIAEDVAPAAVFLASDAGRFITGTVLCVEGGYPSYAQGTDA
jgi:3-oxoacyl-[acyl-carrier protein] reductase